MNILLTSAGRRGYIVDYFKEALGEEGHVFASNSEYTIALQKADDYFITPLIYEEGYIDSIIAYCKDKDINAVISLFDIDLLVLSKSENRFRDAGIELILAPENSVEKCNDKWKTKELLDSLGIMTPITFKSIEDVKEAIRNKEVGYPIVIKPRWGMASLGLYYADNEKELDVFYDKSKKEVAGSYLKYESRLTPREEVIFQEKLEGQEYGVDVINDLKGNYICALPKSKLAMRAGETDLGQTVSPERFNGIAKKLSEAIKHKAILSVDCFDVAGRLYVTELNCRISGHYPLSHVAGVDLPKQIVEWLGQKPTDMKNFNFTEGVYVTKDINPVRLDIHEETIG